MPVQSGPKEQPPLPRLVYTIKEACQVSTLSRGTINNHINAENLEVVRVGGRTLIPVESLHRLISGEE